MRHHLGPHRRRHRVSDELLSEESIVEYLDDGVSESGSSRVARSIGVLRGIVGFQRWSASRARSGLDCLDQCVQCGRFSVSASCVDMEG